MGKIGILARAIINRLTMNEKITAKIVYSIVRQYPKVQRNEACPCGSGEKFKLCCQNKKRLTRGQMKGWRKWHRAQGAGSKFNLT